MSTRIVLLQALASTPGDLRLMVQKLPPALAHQRPDPDNWSVAEIVCHLIDIEGRYRQRLYTVVHEDNPGLPPLYPDESRYDETAVLDTLLDQFSAARAVTVTFLQELSLKQWQRPAVHTNWGPTSLRHLVRHLVEHDINHLNQAVETQQRLRSDVDGKTTKVC
jgi:uncharacterized damage-inducible protein DinB